LPFARDSISQSRRGAGRPIFPTPFTPSGLRISSESSTKHVARRKIVLTAGVEQRQVGPVPVCQDKQRARGLQRRRCGDCNDAAACDRAPAIKVPTKWSTPSAMPRAYSLSWRFATRYPFFNGMTPLERCTFATHLRKHRSYSLAAKPLTRQRHLRWYCSGDYRISTSPCMPGIRNATLLVPTRAPECGSAS
jgi:hypothetical protein